ncbi:MAG TPA: acyltransferase [Niabella sp.]|nr:acyltransferase [Niabella sp.]
MNKPEKIYFANLDALRSIACLFVLVSHIFWDFLTKHFSESWIISNSFAEFFLGNGGLGVRIFFGLSGFLITYLIIKEIQKAGRLNIRHFYIRRILRIWPVYFLVVFFAFGIYYFSKTPIYEKPVMSILFLSNYDLVRILNDSSIYPNGILSLTWSVSVEEQFYLIWPLVLAIIPISKLLIVLCGVILTSVVFSIVNDADLNLIYHHTVSNFIFLGGGAFVAFIVLNRPVLIQKLSKIDSKQWSIFFIIGLAFMIFSKKILFSIKGGSAFYFFVSAVVIASVILNQVANVKRPFNLSRSGFLVKMGKYTYGLYMYHRIAMFLLSLLFSKFFILPSVSSDLLYSVLAFFLAFIISYYSFHIIERPILKWKDRFSIFRKL